jgi:hypothetical protein
MIVRIVSSGVATILIAWYILREVVYYDSMDLLDDARLLPFLFAIGMALLYNFIQPLVQAVLNGVMGMLTSAYTRTRAQSLSFGLVGRLAGWVFAILVHTGIIYWLGYIIIANWSSPYSAPMQVFQGRSTPSDTEVWWVVWTVIGGYLVATLISQCGMILAGLGMILRRSRQLGA